MNTPAEQYPHVGVVVTMRDDSNRNRPTLFLYVTDQQNPESHSDVTTNGKLVVRILFDTDADNGGSDISFYGPDGETLVSMTGQEDDTAVDDTVVNAKLNEAWSTGEGSNFAHNLQAIVLGVVSNIAAVEMAASMAADSGGSIDAQALFTELQGRDSTTGGRIIAQ